MAFESLSIPGISAWGLLAAVGMFAAGAFASNFFDSGVTLKSAFGWAKRNKTKDVTCHLGRHILYRLWSNESEQELVEVIRAEVNLKDTLSGLKFSYTPPGRADKTISGTFTVNGGKLILKCQDEGFMAILCCSGEGATIAKQVSSLAY